MKKTMIVFLILAASAAGVCFANNTVGTTVDPAGGTGTNNWNHNNTTTNSDYTNPAATSTQQ